MRTKNTAEGEKNVMTTVVIKESKSVYCKRDGTSILRELNAS